MASTQRWPGRLANVPSCSSSDTGAQRRERWLQRFSEIHNNIHDEIYTPRLVLSTLEEFLHQV
jgi:hypothetical protein